MANVGGWDCYMHPSTALGDFERMAFGAGQESTLLDALRMNRTRILSKHERLPATHEQRMPPSCMAYSIRVPMYPWRKIYM